jgi:hypothetical protein
MTAAIPQFFKRIESRIALALARAEAALAGVLSLSNHISQTNGAPIGPAATVNWTSTPFVSRTGQVRIEAMATVTGVGGTGVAGDGIVFTLFRDGITFVGVPVTNNIPPGALAASDATLAWDDTVVAGSSHTWAIRVTDGTGGHTITIPTGDALIRLLELPG